MSFEGKVAVVTGASGGMGSRICADLLAAGARVGMLDIQAPDSDSVDTDRARFIKGDLAQAAFVEQAIRELHDWAGGLHYLVNAAGLLDFSADRSLMSISLDDWQRCLNANLSSMMLCSRAAAPLIAAGGGGAMVHIASTQALRGDDRPQDAYQAAKAAVIALSKSLAIQLAGQGVRSNALVPGPTMSPMQARWSKNPDALKAVEAAVPLGRVGTVEDMSNAVLFLLSDRAGFITGTELVVDGGLLARP